MGQSDIMQFFRRNPDCFFSSDEVAKGLGINRKTAYALLKKLKDNDDLELKYVKPKQGSIKTMFAYRIKDDFLEESMHEFNILKQKEKFSTTNASTLQNFLILKELKRLNTKMEEDKNGSKS